MKLSIVLSTQPAQFQAATFKGDLEKNLESIAGMGYDGVELAIRDPQQIDAHGLPRLIRLHGLQVPAIGTGQAWGEEGLSFTDPDPSVRAAAVERIQSHIPLAARLGAVVIIGLIRGTVRPGTDPAQAAGWLVEALQVCSAAAGRDGVRLALEPINRYETSLIQTAAQAMQLIERTGAVNLGLLLDTFHMNIEEADIGESIRRSAAGIFHFHVADSNRLYPGAGHLDFKAILDTLFASGYRGWVSGEFLPVPDAQSAARQAIAHLRGLQE